MTVRTLRIVVFAVSLIGAVVHTSAQSAGPAPKILTVEDYLNYETVADPRISPDGANVVYTRRWVNAKRGMGATPL